MCQSYEAMQACQKDVSRLQVQLHGAKKREAKALEKENRREAKAVKPASFHDVSFGVGSKRPSIASGMQLLTEELHFSQV